MTYSFGQRPLLAVFLPVEAVASKGTWDVPRITCDLGYGPGWLLPRVTDKVALGR